MRAALVLWGVLAACGGTGGSAAPGKPAAAACGSAATSCQRVVDRYLHDADHALRTAEQLGQECKSGRHPETCWAYAWFVADGARVPAHPARARETFTAGCDRKEWPSCRGLGWLRELAVDLDGARELYLKACDAKDWRACTMWGLTWKAQGMTRTPDAAVARYETACTAGEASACAALGEVLAWERGGEADVKRARTLAQTTCGVDVVVGCTLLAQLERNAPAADRDDTLAPAVSARACEQGEMRGCVDLALTAPSEKGRLAAATRACDGGSNIGCDVLGAFYARGQYVRADLAKAMQLYRHACARGDGVGCFNVGVHFASGEGAPQDAREAVKWFEKGCELGAHDGCFWVARAYYTGIGLPASEEHGDRVLQEACLRGLGSACTDMARVYRQDGVLDGITWYDRGCEAADNDGCFESAEWYANPRIKTYDLARARKSYQRACELGQLRGCARWGWMAYQGQGGAPDDAAAARGFYVGCDAGDPDGCHGLGLLYRDGRGVPKDPELALRFARLACAGQSGAGCLLEGLLEVAADRADEAAVAFEKGCAMDHGPSCNRAGAAYFFAWGVARDAGRGIAYAAKGCQLQDGGSCSSACQFQLIDATTSAQVDEALVWAERGCQLDVAQACTYLGRAHERGVGRPVDRLRAVAAYQRGCKHDPAGPCVQLESMPPPADPKWAWSKQEGTCDALRWIDVPGAGLAVLATEVTACQYLACVKAKKCKPPRVEAMWQAPGALLPITGVTQPQATAYCKAQGARLPSSKEWQQITHGDERRRYAWGDAEPSCERLDFGGSLCEAGPSPVGSHPGGATPEGVLDAQGNVAEWTSSFAGGGDKGELSVPMGPSWRELFLGVVLPQRPGEANAETGFRCVKPIKAKKPTP